MTEPEPDSPSRTENADPLAGLNRSDIDAEARLAEATALIERVREAPDLAGPINRLLAEGEPGDGARLALLRALGRSASADPALWPGLLGAIERAQSNATGDGRGEGGAEGRGAERVSLLAAAGAFRLQQAVSLLVEHASPDRPQSERETAFASLGKLTGRSDLGQDFESWRAWSRRAQGMDEVSFLRELLHWKATNAEEARRQRGAVTARLVETHRQLWLRQPNEGQSAYLVSLLGDPLPEIRDLGISLVRQQLASARTLEPAVGEAALALLKASRASVRVEGASLVNQLAPEGGGRLVAEALAVEDDPAAARAMLGAASRWPSEELFAPVLRWIEHGGRPASAAVETAWAMHRADVLPRGEGATGLIEALRGLPESELNGAACRLMVAIGEEADHRRVMSLLRSERGALRLSAAEALQDSPGAIDALIEATADDPELFDAAAKAVRRHRPTLDGFERLSGASAPNAEARREALLRIASALGMSDLVEASGLEGVEPLLGEAMLAGLVSPPGDEAGVLSRARASGLARLAGLRIELGDYEGALAAVGAIPEELRESFSDLDDLRTIALIGLGRLEEARDADGTAAAWLHALELVAERPFAPDALELLATLFGDELSEPERERFASLRRRIAPVNGEGPGGANAGVSGSGSG